MNGPRRWRPTIKTGSNKASLVKLGTSLSRSGYLHKHTQLRLFYSSIPRSVMASGRVRPHRCRLLTFLERTTCTTLRLCRHQLRSRTGCPSGRVLVVKLLLYLWTCSTLPSYANVNCYSSLDSQLLLCFHWTSARGVPLGLRLYSG